MNDSPTIAGKRPASRASKPDRAAFETLRTDEFITYRVSVLSRIFDRHVNRAVLHKRGLSLTESRVLAHLFFEQRGTVRGIAREMHMHRPQISQALMKLVEKGYARKQPDPADGRSAVFSITAKGRRQYGTSLDSARKRQEYMADLLGHEDYWRLGRLLQKLIDSYAEEETD